MHVHEHMSQRSCLNLNLKYYAVEVSYIFISQDGASARTQLLFLIFETYDFKMGLVGEGANARSSSQSPSLFDDELITKFGGNDIKLRPGRLIHPLRATSRDLRRHKEFPIIIP